MRPIGYLAGIGATAFGLALAVIALNVLVDPYRMYGTPVIPGWTALKPRIYQQTGIAKTYQLERVVPRTLLLGNSRVEIGLNPKSREWPPNAQPVFDAAEDGTGLPLALEMLREAIAVRVPDTVILGLDIIDFLQDPTPPGAQGAPPDADARRFLVRSDGKPNRQRPLQIWRDRIATTLTISALYDSLATLLDQNPRTSATMTLRGFNPLHQYRVYAARSGYHELFAQKNAVYEAQFHRYPAPDFADPFRYSSFRCLRRIIELTARHRIRLILYIHPYHADFLEILHQVGLWPSFDNWERALTRVVALEDRKLSVKVPLYDFAEYDRYSTEPVPPPGDLHAKMRWYWESGHYKSALGDQILARIFGKIDHFGSLLTPSDIDGKLAAIRAARLRFLASERRSIAEALPSATLDPTR
jgi:hypothetical protein